MLISSQSLSQKLLALLTVQSLILSIDSHDHNHQHQHLQRNDDYHHQVLNNNENEDLQRHRQDVEESFTTTYSTTKSAAFSTTDATAPIPLNLVSPDATISPYTAQDAIDTNNNNDNNNEIAEPTPAIFDSCLIACYSDIVTRFGAEFAEKLKSEGFIFGTCPYDDDDVVGGDAMEGEVQRHLENVHVGHHHHHHHGHHDDHDHNHHSQQQHEQQAALHRILGATNQLSRLWHTTTSTGPTRNTQTGLLQIPYSIKSTVPSDIFTPETYNTIHMALSHIEQMTGVIQFIPRTNFEKEYLFFTYESGWPYAYTCAANVGKQTHDKTSIYLGWCRSQQHLGNIIHEILHALGFWHEHTRPDRDSHVSILWDNVRDGAESAFQKALDVDSLGSGYDLGSIMHYPYNGFVNTTKGTTTIQNLNGLGKGVSMGQRVRLSGNDVDQLRLLYQCASGPRSGEGLTLSNLCSVDCKCWEYALGECTSDEECMDDLICGDTPSNYAEIMNSKYSVDTLPYYPHATGTFSCEEFCHTACCDGIRFPNAILRCPETCNSVVEEDFGTLPSKMCLNGDGSGPTTKTGSTLVAATTTTTTTTTTTATTSINAEWYVDWGLSGGKCVQDCIGSAPCNGRRETWEAPYSSVNICCSTMSWKPFDECAYLPVSPAPSRKPTPKPSRSPTNPPTNPQPTNIPTPEPSSSPSRKPTPLPSASPTPGPTSTPSKSPTPGPTVPPTAPPSEKPTISPKPTETPTKMPTATPTAPPTPQPSSDPTLKPTPNPSNQPSPKPSRKPTNKPSSVPTRPPTKPPTKPPTSSTWYPDMETNTNKCKNDGNPPSWLSASYTAQEICCSSHFSWAFTACMGVEPEPSYKWFIDWGVGTCVQECPKTKGGKCGGFAPGAWTPLHGSQSLCCSAHVSYNYAFCMGT